MTKRFDEWNQPVFDEDGWAYKNWIMRNDKRSFGWKCFHPENLVIGEKCDVGIFSLLQATYGIELGDFVEIGPYVYISSWSTIDDKQGRVIIKKGAKIGAHSTVMPGVTIGENSVIGAHSFVNCNIPDNVLAYGIPCKVVRNL